MLVFMSGEFSKTLANLSRLFAANANRRFQFQKSRQLLIGPHNERCPWPRLLYSHANGSPQYSALRIARM